MAGAVRDYTKFIGHMKVTFSYHPKTKMWTGRIHAGRGEGTLPGGSGYTYLEAEEATRALIRNSTARS